MIGRSSYVFLYFFICENTLRQIVHSIVFAQTEEKNANTNNAYHHMVRHTGGMSFDTVF